ncbi:MAG: hypothetical protein ACT4QC_18600 [Planctomycetaceae bacterium]
MSHNRIRPFFRPAGEGFAPSAEQHTLGPSADSGFMLIPAHLLPFPPPATGKPVTSALSKLYERAFEAARKQAAQVPANRLAGFWNKGRSQ